jgi:hypothetical protein
MGDRARLFALVVATMLIASTLLPLAMWRWPSLLYQTNGSGFFQVFYSQALLLALGLIATARYRYGSGLFRAERIPQLLLLLACIAQIHHSVSTINISFDYHIYSTAANAVDGGSLYETRQYLYSPLFAGVFHAAKSILLNVVGSQPTQDIDALIFYLYQSLLLFASFYIVIGLYRIGKQNGLTELVSAGIVCALMSINFPLLRAFEFNQASILLGALGVWVFANHDKAAVVGMSIAAAGFIKLYPFVAVIFLLQAKKWSYVIWTVAASAVLLALGIILTGVDHWIAYANTILEVAGQGAYYAMGNVAFTDGIITIARLLEAPALAAIIRIGMLVFFLAISFWMVQRKSKSYDRIPLILGISAILSLTISPVVWHHQYLTVLPVIVWLFSIKSEQTALAVAAILLFAVPTIPSFLSVIIGVIGTALLWVSLKRTVGSDPILLSDSKSAALGLER